MGGGIWMKNLKPDMMLDSIYDIDYIKLKNLNKKGLLIDLDNTLIEWDKRKAEEKLINWLLHTQKEGFKICIISNNTEDRVIEFIGDLEIPTIHKALKPMRKSFNKGIGILGLKKQEIAVVGDQVFTDILGGNRTGLYTILVKPMGGKEFWWTTIVRKIEKIVLRNM